LSHASGNLRFEILGGWLAFKDPAQITKQQQFGKFIIDNPESIEVLAKLWSTRLQFRKCTTVGKFERFVDSRLSKSKTQNHSQ